LSRVEISSGLSFAIAESSFRFELVARFRLSRACVIY
jgi:hypothetical protein